MSNVREANPGTSQGKKFTEQLIEFRRLMNGAASLSSAELINVILGQLKVAVEMLTAQDKVITQLQNELAASHKVIEQEHRRYQELVEYNPFGYLRTDMDGRILQVNREAANLLNAPEALLLDKPMVLFIDEDERRSFNAHVQGRFRASRRIKYKARIKPSNASPFDSIFIVSAVNDSNGTPTSLLWVMQTPGREEK